MGNSFNLFFNQQPLIIAVEGNIGVGKSTFLSHMKRTVYYMFGTKVIYLEEPVGLWQNLAGKDMLKQFYSDQEKHAFEFQMLASISRLKLLQDSIKQNKNAVYVIERSYMSDFFIFTRMLAQQNKLTPQQQAILNMWFSSISLKIDHVVYLKSSPAVAHERCVKRNRTGEDAVSLEYIEACHDKYESWLRDDPGCIVLDCDEDLSQQPYSEHLAKIEERIVVKNKLLEPLLESLYGFRSFAVTWFYSFMLMCVAEKVSKIMTIYT